MLFSQDIKPLTIGDKVPDVVLGNMLNYKTSQGKLSDFKGKAIIIDMWFRECGACREAMPHLDSLQKEFKDDLQVLLVTWQPKAHIEEFWRANRNFGHLKFTQAVEDSTLRKLFPARGFPHQIWINKDGIVVAITGGQSTNKGNVKKLIHGEPVNLPVKRDEMDSRVAAAVDPLMNIRFEENRSNLLYYSYFSKRRPEFNGGSSLLLDTANQIVRVKFTNTDFLYLYDCAYSNKFGSDLHRPTRMVREDSNPIATKSDYQNYTNVFCYDLMYKDSTYSNFGKFMVSDLDRFFGVKSHEEIREIPCYILRPTGANENYKQKLNPDENYYLTNPKLKKGEITEMNGLEKAWFSTVIRSLMLYVDKPLLLELGDAENLNFRVTWNLENLPAMNKELAEYGLEIVIEDRPRKVIVLKD